jgi:hypothetical protein
MTLVELKDFIINKRVPTTFMIFLAKDNRFLAKQYSEALGKLTTEGIQKISSIYEPLQSSLSLLTTSENKINLLSTETFDEIAENYEQFENTIVICDQIDKSILNLVEPYVIKMPKFEDWQLFDYVKTNCPTLDDSEVEWLIKATKSDINRITNELAKINLFSAEEQKQLLNEIRFDPQTDLYSFDLFTIVNAITEGDLPTLFEFLKHKNYDELEPVVLANRVLSSLKNILIVTQNPTLTAEECGVSAAQFRKLKYKYRSINVESIKYKIKFLTQFDLALKTSKLELSKQDMLNYLINNLAYSIIK